LLGRILICGVLLALALVAASATAAPAAPVPARFDTAIYAGPVYLEPDTQQTATATAFRRIVQSGARYVRVSLYWKNVVSAHPPAGFDARDPKDPSYRWSVFDGIVKRAVTRGLTPIVTIWGSPEWAKIDGRPPPAGNMAPRPATLANFAFAAATRYGGTTRGIPRLRYWMIWNEPNYSYYISPVFAGARPAAPEIYRNLVNAAAESIHAVHRDNRVIAGGLEPFTHKQPQTIAPLRFMRELLCVPGNETGCDDRVSFDIWSMHPYTSGGPTHKAIRPDDVSLGNLPAMKKVLDAAWRSRRIDASRPPAFWVTEFSWDSNPPDPRGVPMTLEVRWVAEAMYRMWQSGVSLMTWLQLRDDVAAGDIQSGLYFRGKTGLGSDRAKPLYRAFRFPFVGFRRSTSHLTYWGRVPAGRAGSVRIELKRGGGGWRRLAVVRANSNGLFTGTLPRSVPRIGFVRAISKKDVSPAFSLVVPHDHAVTPFGVGPRG